MLPAVKRATMLRDIGVYCKIAKIELNLLRYCGLKLEISLKKGAEIMMRK
jgi:hypothetical protein